MDNQELQKRECFLKLAQYKMPYGKYQGKRLIDLPEPYVIWLHRQGLPAGELGKMLAMVYEIKINGLEYLFAQFKNNSKPAKAAIE